MTEDESHKIAAIVTSVMDTALKPYVTALVERAVAEIPYQIDRYLEKEAHIAVQAAVEKTVKERLFIWIETRTP